MQCLPRARAGSIVAGRGVWTHTTSSTYARAFWKGVGQYQLSERLYWKQPATIPTTGLPRSRALSNLASTGGSIRTTKSESSSSKETDETITDIASIAVYGVIVIGTLALLTYEEMTSTEDKQQRVHGLHRPRFGSAIDMRQVCNTVPMLTDLTLCRLLPNYVLYLARRVCQRTRRS